MSTGKMSKKVSKGGSVKGNKKKTDDDREDALQAVVGCLSSKVMEDIIDEGSSRRSLQIPSRRGSTLSRSSVRGYINQFDGHDLTLTIQGFSVCYRLPTLRSSNTRSNS